MFIDKEQTVAKGRKKESTFKIDETKIIACIILKILVNHYKP